MNYNLRVFSTQAQPNSPAPKYAFDVESKFGSVNLPHFSYSNSFLCRDQNVPPEIGFRSDLLDSVKNTQGSAPYPMVDSLTNPKAPPPYPTGNVDGSMSLPNDSETPQVPTPAGESRERTDSVSSSSSSFMSTGEEHVIFPSNTPRDTNEGREFLRENVIRVEEPRRKMTSSDRPMRMVRHGIPYPVKAYEEIRKVPCNHCSGCE